jgi:ABC-type uncharacterized transport system involved in gliding motility auxiliary subunit
MKRIDLLTPVAFALMIGAWAWTRQDVRIPGRLEYYLVAGAVLIIVHLILRGGDVARAIGGRQMRYGSNTLVLTLALLGILGGLNYLAFRLHLRWDLTKSHRLSLSDQTRKVLHGLKDDIKIVYFARKDEMFRGQDQLRSYQALSPKISFEFVDPLTSPVKTQSYGVRGPFPTVILESGERRERISNDTEQDITNAIIKLTKGKRKTICFAKGEGERELDDVSEAGLSKVRAALVKATYDTKAVALLSEGRVPEECSVFVVGGPAKDLLPSAIDAIRTYAKGGGKLLVMLEPELQASFPNVTALLREWNIEAGKDVVLDPGTAKMLGTDPFTPVAVQYPYHAITKDFKVMTVFQTARTMRAGSATIDGVSAQNLAETSPSAWGETDLTLKPPVRPDAKDTTGPLSLAACSTMRIPDTTLPNPPAGETKRDKEARLVAFGDVDFASNQFLEVLGNQDFLLNSIAWLGEDTDMISIRPPDPANNRMFLTQAQQQYVLVFSLVVLPGVFLVAGIWAWWRRRG